MIMKKYKMENRSYCIFLLMFTSSQCLVGCRSESLRFAPRKSENDWISKVHVVFMNHLDVGYTDLINNVLNKYFQIYFDHAIQVSASLRNLGYVENMVYTTHPWLVSLYLNCPPNFVLSGIKLKCPDQKQRNDFVEAIRRGDITWHAGPMNLQIEFIEPWLFEAALDISSDLDKKFNITRKCRVISQRDVPGLTQASIPILIKKGITYLTVGVNGATPPPGVPKLFKWKYGKDSIVVNVHPGGYPNDPGSTPIDPKGLSREDCITHEGFSEALCFVFRTDNTGPPASIQEVLNMYEILRAEFPKAVLVSGTLENFFASFDDQIKDTLPLITNEIGDTWIQGIASDPKKNAEYLFISHKIKNCIDSGVCSLNDRRLWNATRFLIKLPEHTWGYYSEHDTEHWNNPSFEPLRKVNPNFLHSANSWWEQRNFSLAAIEALEDHVIAQEIKNEMPFLNADVPDLMNFQHTTTRQFSCPTANIKNLLFGEDGTILRLTFQNNELADEKHVIGKFVYQTFNETDFEEFGKIYNYNGWSAGYYKPNCTASAHPESKIWNTVLKKIYINKCVKECDFWLNLNMNDSKSVSWYGAPSEIWIRYTSRMAKYEKGGSSSGLDVVLQWFNKTITRLPESISFAFKPIVRPHHKWTIYKMMQPVDPYNVLLNGSQYNHVASAEGVEYKDDKCLLVVKSHNIPIVNVLTGHEFAHTFPAPLSPIKFPEIEGFSFNMFNNIWETNYIMWYPYLDKDKDFKAIFTIDMLTMTQPYLF